MLFAHLADQRFPCMSPRSQMVVAAWYSLGGGLLGEEIQDYLMHQDHGVLEGQQITFGAYIAPPGSISPLCKSLILKSGNKLSYSPNS